MNIGRSPKKLSKQALVQEVRGKQTAVQQSVQGLRIGKENNKSQRRQDDQSLQATLRNSRTLQTRKPLSKRLRISSHGHCSLFV